mgnify:CR=1 FL=1
MKYKVGDKVRVREDLTDGDYGSNLYTTPGMLVYRGKTATVTAVQTYGRSYHLDIDNKHWGWNDEMLEDYNETQAIIDKLESELKNNKEKNKKAGNMLKQGALNDAHKDLLFAQTAAYRTVDRILKARIDLLKQDLEAPKQEPEKKYYYHLIGGNNCTYINYKLDRVIDNYWFFGPNSDKPYYKASFTDEEIKKSPYDLTKFEKEEVKQDD